MVLESTRAVREKFSVDANSICGDLHLIAGYGNDWFQERRATIGTAASADSGPQLPEPHSALAEGRPMRVRIEGSNEVSVLMLSQRRP
jgi:hypothetical protein